MSARPAERGVLLVTDRFPVGGLERVIVDLAGALVARGERVGVLADAGGAMWAAVPRGCARHAVRVGRPAALARLRALRRLAASGRYDVLHAHQRGVALLARVAAAGTGCIVVEHVHNVFPATPLARLLAFRAPVLIACSGAIGGMLTGAFGRPAHRVRVVVNGVADPLGGSSPLPSQRPLRLVGAGRVAEQKDPLRFVRVVAALAARLPPGALQATWIGDGPLLPAVRAERDARGLGGVLDLPGRVADPGVAYADAHALLLTSRTEGLPLVALEALAVGRGAVLPAVGGCADAVDASTGLLYDPAASDEALAELLAARLTPDALESWSAAARPRWAARFTVDRMAGEILAVYEDARRGAADGIAA